MKLRFEVFSKHVFSTGYDRFEKENEMKRSGIPAFCVLLAILTILARPVVAAEYYVSKSGNDGAAGTRDAPWRHCPGMPDWSGGTQLQPGDTVYFDSADTWESAGIVLQITGGVTYDGSTWGSGLRARFHARGDVRQGEGIIDFEEDHPTLPTIVRGFEADGSKVNGDGHFITGVALQDAVLEGATKRVENCIIHDISHGGTPNHHYGITVSGWQGHTTRNVEILDCEVSVNNTGIIIYGGYSRPIHIDGVWIRGCVVHDVHPPSDIGDNVANGITLKGHLVNAIVERNIVYNTHSDGISVNGSRYDNIPDGPMKVIIRQNIVRDCETGGILITNDTGNRKGISVDVYGNLVFNNNFFGIAVPNWAVGTYSVNIYGNTLYHNGNKRDRCELSVSESSSTEIVRLAVRNNIFYPIPGGSSVRGESRITELSHNLTTDPGFVNEEDLPTEFVDLSGKRCRFTSKVCRPNTDGLSITEDSPAYDAGIEILEESFNKERFDSSINSVTRPYGGGWDIGAYELGEPD